MQPKKFLPAIFILTIAVAVANHAIIQNSFQSWIEPLLLVAHIIVVFVLYFYLQIRIGVRASLVGALFFALFPAHAYILSIGQYGIASMVFYIGIWLLSARLAVAYEQFYKFLKTQEDIVRHLFLVGVYALVVALFMMTLQQSAIFKNEKTLWGYRVLHHPTAQAYTQWAAVLLKEGKDDEAQNIYKQAIHEFPKASDSYLLLADIYIASGKREDLVKLLNQLLDAVPDNEDVYLRVMEVYGKAIAQYPQELIYQEKREEMLAQYEQVSKRKKYTANDYFNLGFLYEQVGGYEQALRFYRKALALNPKHEKSLVNVANHLKEVGDYKSAIILYERIIKLNPRNMSAYLNEGIIFNALGDVNRAREMYEKVIKIDANNAQAYFNLGYINETANELREALNNYEKAVDINPKHDEAYYNMGNVYATLGQSAEAIAAYLKTISINPNHMNACVNLSILSYKLKDFKGAIHYLEEAQLLGYNAPEEYLKTLEPYRKK